MGFINGDSTTELEEKELEMTVLFFLVLTMFCIADCFFFGEFGNNAFLGGKLSWDFEPSYPVTILS